MHSDRIMRYFSRRTVLVLKILDAADAVTKTACASSSFNQLCTNYAFSEFARVFGVDFFSVLSRGSQFKVESFMFRIAKPECFLLLSPSKQDVSHNGIGAFQPLIRLCNRLASKTLLNAYP